MFVISDSNIFLIEKVAHSKDIFIEGNTNLIPECDKQISRDCKNVLILLSDIFYKKFNIINFKNYNSEGIFKNEFKIIDELIKNLSERGLEIYIPLIPKHFIYKDKFSLYFLEKESPNLFIDEINNIFCKKYAKNENVIFLKGIGELSPSISKTYYRFSSIYDKENSNMILDQYLEYEKSVLIKKNKLIVFDLDNTIWKGILGDDSIEGVRMNLSDPVGSVFNNVQNILLRFKEKGFLLAVCSKNNQELALKCLFKNSSCLFSDKDIISHRINWQPKSENIKSICKELNISLLDTIFIDDSDYECDEVKENCKGISIFKVPKDIYKYPFELANNKLFYIGISSIEDKKRTVLYKNNQKRNEIYKSLITEKGNKDKWIKSLNIKLELHKLVLGSKSKDRVIQLFNRTNQFNLNGKKFNVISLNEKLIRNSKYYFGTIIDRIGSEGLISVVGFRIVRKSIFVENYILSCRVFGRYVEESMLIPLFDNAIKIKSDIYFEFKDTNRNNVIKEFIRNLTNNDFYLSLPEIIELKIKFSKLPITIINSM